MADKKVVGVYLEPALDKELKLISTLLDKSKSEICQQAIKDWFKKNKREIDKAKEGYGII